MKKIKYISLLSLTGLAAVTLALASCGNNNGNNVSTKEIYGLDENKEIQKMGESELLFKQNSSIPYISLEDGTKLLSEARSEVLEDKKYKLELNKVGTNYVVSNETGAKCSIDKENQTFTYDDYDKFMSIVSENQKPLSTIIIGKKNKAIKLLSSKYIAGKEVVMSLKKYSALDIYENNDKLYLPLSVYNSTLLQASCNVNLAYNGKYLFVMASDALVDNTSGEPSETEIAKKFRDGAATDKISDEMLEYYYQSICFDFDYNYGLKEKFTSFDEFVKSYKLKDGILSTNPKQIDNGTGVALTWLNDGHTGLTEFSNLYKFRDNSVDTTKTNPIKDKHDENDENFQNAHKAAKIQDGIEYKNDTVFVTFPSFTENKEELLYSTEYSEEIGKNLGIDKKTFDELLKNSTAKIFSNLYKDLQNDEHKNIKNIVIDLTANAGGAADALIYSLSTLIGNVTIEMDNPLSGGHNKQVYKADMNLDGVVDEKDKPLIEQNYNIYFLDSEYSFSSANAMPYLAKLNNDKVVTLGAKTHGGPCAVRGYITPIGSVISSSSLSTFTKYVDGKYVNLDDGIAADFALTEAQMLDRNYIVENIKNWKK